MKKGGLTLLEVTIVIVISTIIGLAIGFNFLAAHNFRAMTQDTVAIAREARIAMSHMRRVLKFAKPDTINAGLNQISATIEGGHLEFITSDTNIAYTRDSVNKTIEYTQAASTTVIAGAGERGIDITYLDGTWYSAESELEVKVTAEKGGRSVSLQTRIKVLKEEG